MPWFRRKHHAFDEPFPEEWRAVIAANLSHWKYLDADDREHLEDTVLWLVFEKRWEAARGFELTYDIQVTIAAHAALLVLGFDVDDYASVDTIIVHSSTIVLRDTQSGLFVNDGPQHLLGLAQYRGPVIIAWDEALANARHPERGHNVIYHEFAHKLDMLDGTIDGTPPLETQQALDRWNEVFSHELDELRASRAEGLLSPYGATNNAEFFAVVTEVFFDQGAELAQSSPALYDVLREFYRQDPARRTPLTE